MRSERRSEEGREFSMKDENTMEIEARRRRQRRW